MFQGSCQRVGDDPIGSLALGRGVSNEVPFPRTGLHVYPEEVSVAPQTGDFWGPEQGREAPRAAVRVAVLSIELRVLHLPGGRVRGAVDGVPFPHRFRYGRVGPNRGRKNPGKGAEESRFGSGAEAAAAAGRGKTVGQTEAGGGNAGRSAGGLGDAVLFTRLHPKTSCAHLHTNLSLYPPTVSSLTYLLLQHLRTVYLMSDSVFM